jgi:WD40 repeat protein
MGWPLSQDYNEAVQNPRTSFADPDLKAGEAVPGPLGLPLPRSGNFADVYQIRGADGRMWALKCFTRPAAELRERYLAIDAHLRDARLPFTIGFEFLTEGVRIRGLWYPALKMEWVEGPQLNAFVRENLGRPEHLRAILGVWVRLCKRLRDANIAHADLQHGNVLLLPGATARRLKLRLIDYDGMWVPALSGNPSGEAGHPNFQHPARLADRAYTAEVDRFPHLVIGCALRALAVAGQPLWDRFDNGDNLLFREADFADPAASKLFRSLWELDDPTVTNLVALLAVSAGRSIGDTPWLDEVLTGDKTVPVSDAVLAKAADLIRVKHRAARRAVPATQLFVVPEEANQFPDFGGQSTPSRRRRVSKLPVLIAGAAAVAAVAVVAAVLFLRDDSPREDRTPAPQITEDKGATPVATRPGLVETKWVNFPSAPQAPRVERIVSGIDIAPPGTKVVRTYPVRGAASLGAWLRLDGAHAIVINQSQIGELELATGRVTAKPIPKTVGQIKRVAVTPDGQHVIVVGAEKAIHCLDYRTGRTEWTKTFPGPVTALVVTPDGERVAASGEKVGYVEWFIGDGSEVRRHELLQASRLAFSPDGSHAVAVNEGGVEIWSLDEGKVTVVAPGLAATAVTITPNGEQALAVGVGREVRDWAVSDGHELPERPAPLRQGVTILTVTADNTSLFGGPGGEIAYIGPDGTNAIFGLGSDAGAIVDFSITADGHHALVASEKGNISLTRLADLVRPGGSTKDGPAVGSLDYVRSTQISPDVMHFAADSAGERFLTANSTHVRVHAADTFAPGRPLQIPDGGIVTVGFGPDDFVLICQTDGDTFRTRTYDPGGGSAGPLFALPATINGGEPGRITRFTQVPDRTWVLATTEVVGDVLFDPATGKIVPGWPEPKTGEPTVAAPSPDGKVIAFGTTNNSIKLWDVDTQKTRRSFEGSAGEVALAFAPDGRSLIGLWPHGRIRVWDSATGRLLKEVDHSYSGPFTEMSALADSLIVVGSATSRILMNLNTGKVMNMGDGPDPLVGRGLVVPVRGWVFAADHDQRLTAWTINDARSRRLPAKTAGPSPWPEVPVIRDAPVSPPVGLAFAADGKFVVVATENGRLTRFTADRLLFAGEVDTEDSPIFSFTVAGDQVFTLGRKSIVTMRDAMSFEKKFEVPSQAPGNAAPILVAATPDGLSVVVSSDKARLVDVKTRKEAKTGSLPMPAVGKRMTQFVFSADGKISVGRWGDAVTAVWNPKTGQPRVLEELPVAVAASPQGLAVTPNGKVALLGTGDGKLTAWDTMTGKELFSQAVYPDAGEGEAIAAIAVLPTGIHFVTAGRDGRVILWELDGFRKLKEFHGSQGAWRLAVAPDGRSVVMQRPGDILRIDLPDVGKREP